MSNQKVVLEVSYLIWNKRKQHHIYGQNEREIKERRTVASRPYAFLLLERKQKFPYHFTLYGLSRSCKPCNPPNVFLAATLLLQLQNRNKGCFDFQFTFTKEYQIWFGVALKAEVAEVLGKWGARPKSLVNREEEDDEKRCRKASSSS